MNMSEESRNYFISYERVWTTRDCPLCKQRLATAHGLLYRDPLPETFDTRQPVGEVYFHETGQDCVVLAHSERRPQIN
jgi:hypothetical protein